MTTPATERETLSEVMRQVEIDLRAAHAEICKLQGLDPARHSWPDWSPQANTLRWFGEIRARFNLSTVAECTDDLGHVFEVRGDPPYKCTFCGFHHEETVGGLFVRATQR